MKSILIAFGWLMLSATIALAQPGPPSPTSVPPPSSGAAPVRAVNSVALFTATTGDQAMTGLTLPGKYRITNPQYIIGTTTINLVPLLVNYYGGNACTSPSVSLSPGQIDDWIYQASTTIPHVCVPSGTLSIIGAQ